MNMASIKKYLLGLYVNELLYKTSREGFDFDKIYKRYKDFLVILSTLQIVVINLHFF